MFQIAFKGMGHDVISFLLLPGELDSHLNPALGISKEISLIPYWHIGKRINWKIRLNVYTEQ